MNFTGRFTAGPDQLAVAGGETGAGEADFFLGLPDLFGRGINSTGPWGQRANVFGAYFQDDWRAADTLTLNLGLRLFFPNQELPLVVPCDGALFSLRNGSRNLVVLVVNGEIGMASQANSAAASIG